MLWTFYRFDVNQELALTKLNRIVEYATRDQAQTAVSTLSNQNLMGRLVYVREVIALKNDSPVITGTLNVDHQTFIGP